MWRAMKNARYAGIVAALRQRSIGAVVAPVPQFARFSCSDCFFEVCEVAEVDRLLVVLDVGSPFGILLVPGYPGVSGSVVAWLTSVLVVLLVRNVSQVRDSVISSDSINVIYLVIRPYTMHVQPCKSVSLVESALYRDQQVAVSIQAACYVPDFYPVSCANFPGENSGIRIVAEHRPQMLCGKLIRGRCGTIVFRHR